MEFPVRVGSLVLLRKVFPHDHVLRGVVYSVPRVDTLCRYHNAIASHETVDIFWDNFARGSWSIDDLERDVRRNYLVIEVF